MGMVWLGVAALALVTELMTTALVSVWFVVGAALASLVAFLGGNAVLQAVVFVVTSLVLFCLYLCFFKKKWNKAAEKTNIDSLIGQKATVTSCENGVCRAKVRFQDWQVRDESNAPYAVGDTLEICRIEGATLVCKKLGASPAETVSL